MRLKKLYIEHYSPFSTPTTLEIDQKVTVLTGQNDVGKSSILRLINLICSGKKAEIDDVNSYRIYSSSTPWDKDTHIKCTASFELLDTSPNYVTHVSGNPPAGDIYDVEFQLTTGHISITNSFRPSIGNFSTDGFMLKSTPASIYLPKSHKINSVIDVNQINEVEQELLQLCFGANGVEKLKALAPAQLNQQVRQANRRLNDYLKQVLPTELGFELSLDLDARSPEVDKFIVSIRDTHGADTPFHLRGTGIRKTVELIVSLVLASRRSDYIIILYDEPENSLHADAQHKFRMFLETIADQPNIQVIYSTHSPSMINAFSYTGLRLLERTSIDGKATTVVNNKPYRENFSPVRSSLGLNPSDSLLYAPVTVIVEGETEIKCLPLLVKKLFDSDVSGFEDVDKLMSQCHFIDGSGDSLDYWCRMAKSQGSKPIVYVDGDKVKRINQLIKDKKLVGALVVTLKEQQEFEDIVPEEIYFQALKDVSDQEIEYSAYQEWCATTNPPQRMFSKRVDRWLQDTFGFSLDKPTVMKRAIEIVDLEKIDLASIHKFIEHTKTHLKS